MLATSVTTCAAFVACAVSPIWDIQCFGVVSAVMVFADYLLVITFLPAACIVREQGTSRNGARTASRHRWVPRRRPTIKWMRCGRRTRKPLHLWRGLYGEPFADFVIKGKNTPYHYSLFPY